MSEKMTIVPSANPLRPGEVPAVAAGIVLHKFVKADSFRGALTPDSTGENLPLNGSAWIYAKQILVSPTDRRIGATSLQILSGVSARGYFLFPISDDV